MLSSLLPSTRLAGLPEISAREGTLIVSSELGNPEHRAARETGEADCACSTKRLRELTGLPYASLVMTAAPIAAELTCCVCSFTGAVRLAPLVDGLVCGHAPSVAEPRGPVTEKISFSENLAAAAGR